MKYQHLTWYILEDGTHADPNDVAPDDKGVLRHKKGLAVATHDNGVPMTVGVAAVEGGNVIAAQDDDAAVEKVTREMTAAAKPQANKKPGFQIRKKAG